MCCKTVEECFNKYKEVFPNVDIRITRLAFDYAFCVRLSSWERKVDVVETSLCDALESAAIEFLALSND